MKSKFASVGLLLALTGSASASAQNSQPSGQPSAQGQQQRPAMSIPPRSRPPREEMRRTIQQVPAGFAIPLPPDAKFVMGYQSKYQGTKMNTCFRFTSANSSLSLFDWYKKTLTSYGFTANGTFSPKAHSTSQLSGARNTSSYTINISNPINPSGTDPTGAKERTSVMIEYGDR